MNECETNLSIHQPASQLTSTQHAQTHVTLSGEEEKILEHPRFITKFSTSCQLPNQHISPVIIIRMKKKLVP